ncbi:hypothetical protein ACKOKD_05995 [Bacillus mojavensis]|uniref:hypothetical protein n=1 Tax=Bacillus mojavensis TaxID=72360 RepID=UPI003967A1B1
MGKFIEVIRITEAKYVDELNFPVTDQEIRNFEEAVLGKFPVNEIPSGYKKFLQTVNGLDFNGLVNLWFGSRITGRRK